VATPESLRAASAGSGCAAEDSVALERSTLVAALTWADVRPGVYSAKADAMSRVAIAFRRTRCSIGGLSARCRRDQDKGFRGWTAVVMRG
jgi:hypothetical protein